MSEKRLHINIAENLFNLPTGDNPDPESVQEILDDILPLITSYTQEQSKDAWVRGYSKGRAEAALVRNIKQEESKRTLFTQKRLVEEGAIRDEVKRLLLPDKFSVTLTRDQLISVMEKEVSDFLMRYLFNTWQMGYYSGRIQGHLTPLTHGNPELSKLIVA